MRRRMERSRARWPPWLAAGGLIGGYFVITGTLSARRPLWNDELFTYYIAARPTLPDVWAVLLTGAEQLPPFFYLITRTGLALFGISEFSLRVFEMLGVAAAALSVFFFARHRASSVSAAAGAIFLLCTSAYQYAYEARPYGLVLAFSGLALVAWQCATEKEGSPRRIALAVLALMLSAAVHTHYYAILVFGPLCAAELTRGFVRRRLDLPVWVSLAFPLATIVPLAPLLRAAAGYSGKFWARPSWLGTLDAYGGLLYPAVPAILLVAVVVSGFGPAASPAQSKRPQLHEFVVIAGLALLPFQGIVLAKMITGAFTIRYVLPALLGIAVLVAWGLDWAVGDRPRVAVIATVLLGTCFLAKFVQDKRAVQADADHVRYVCRFLTGTDPNLPLVIASPHLFFQLSHYAPRQLAARLAYLGDIKIGLDRTQTDSVERGLMSLKPIAPLNVVSYRSFLHSQQVFLVYATPGPYSWVVPQLVDDGRKLELAGAHGDASLFLVTEAANARR
jgi:hypothetical protein